MIRAILFWEGAKERLADQKGQGLVEYALILGLVVVVSIGILTTMGGDISAKLTTVSNALK